MMKKILILMLVLGLVSVANATVSMELREADGVTPVANLDQVLVGGNYVLVVSGDAADAPQSLGIYGAGYAMSDWAALGAADMATAATAVDTGNLSYINWNATYSGYDSGIDDYLGPGVSTGDWLTVDLSGLAEGTFALDLLDYNAGSTVIGSVAGTVIVPEPITIALLGLGGLFLRRRK